MDMEEYPVLPQFMTVSRDKYERMETALREIEALIKPLPCWRWNDERQVALRKAYSIAQRGLYGS